MLLFWPRILGPSCLWVHVVERVLAMIHTSGISIWLSRLIWYSCRCSRKLSMVEGWFSKWFQSVKNGVMNLFLCISIAYNVISCRTNFSASYEASDFCWQMAHGSPQHLKPHHVKPVCHDSHHSYDYYHLSSFSSSSRWRLGGTVWGWREELISSSRPPSDIAQLVKLYHYITPTSIQ